MTALMTTLAINCGTNLNTMMVVRMVSATVTGEYLRLLLVLDTLDCWEIDRRSERCLRKDVSDSTMRLCLEIHFR